jgi:hypothetical protein
MIHVCVLVIAKALVESVHLVSRAFVHPPPPKFASMNNHYLDGICSDDPSYRYKMPRLMVCLILYAVLLCESSDNSTSSCRRKRRGAEMGSKLLL